MQLKALLALLATVSAATVVSLPPRGEPLANGLYHKFVDESGNITTEFTPASELAGSATDISDVALEARSELAKRREGCGGGVNSGDSDEANRLLLNFLSNTDNIRLGQGEAWGYTYNSALSYICPYSGGFKWKSDIAGNWNWIKTTLCGLNRGGYAQVLGGQGDWTSGYTWNGDGFCW